jgi:outer membrane protein OmpA-like peptidoglycan-associated protein
MVGFKVEFGSAQLRPASVAVLRELGKELNGGLSDQKLFEIGEHTDAVGTFGYNEQLSQARAEAVKEFLAKEMNVAPERLKVVGRAFCESVNPSNPYMKPKTAASLLSISRARTGFARVGSASSRSR